MNKFIKNELMDRIAAAAQNAITVAYEQGQSEDVKALKAELDAAMKHAQEAHDFIQVVLNRISTIPNDFDGSTVGYIQAARKELRNIKGIKEYRA